MKNYSLKKYINYPAELINPLYSIKKPLIKKTFILTRHSNNNLYWIPIQIIFILFLLLQSGCRENIVSPLVFGDTTLTDLGLNNIGASSIIVSGGTLIFIFQKIKVQPGAYNTIPLALILYLVIILVYMPELHYLLTAQISLQVQAH
jgi:hypothetical protein